jgi:acyl-CoA synthetase (AMP-forming)/AMP-acid ligase II
LEKYPHIEERYYPLLKKLKETGNHTALTQVLTKEFSQIKNGLFYFIKGRIKDIIIAKGQNIPCDEIEAGALVHPGIFEAVAVGILDRQDGEVPGIVATRHPESSTSATELLEFTRSRRILPRIQWPVMAAIVESLPKTPTGKYQRIRAREVFSVVNLIEDLKTPATTAKFKIQILDLAVTPDYDLSRRPKEI